MTMPLAEPKSGKLRDQNLLRQLPLIELIERIVTERDAAALQELHNHRRVFRQTSGERANLVEFLDSLARTSLARKWVGGRQTALDKAFDLALDRFWRLPQAQPTKNSADTSGAAGHRDGTDCRSYFSAYLDFSRRELGKRKGLTFLERETLAAAILQRQVARHFYLACLECNRGSNPLVRRYYWKLTSGTLCVWIPTHLTGRDARRWLEANVLDADAGRSGESERVQAIINDRLTMPRLLQLGFPDDRLRWTSVAMPPNLFSTVEAIDIRGLAAAVADEKAECVSSLRPAIRDLGAPVVRDLVLRIFEAISTEKLELSTVAHDFGISKATLSRFAGTRWSTGLGDGGPLSIPDLWRNTARVLSGHSAFVEAAKSSGVWPRVESVLVLDRRGRRDEP